MLKMNCTKILKEQVKMREKKLQTKNKVEGDQGSSWVIEESSPYPFSHFCYSLGMICISSSF